MIKLHIGCGKRDFGEDWIHIDGNQFPHVKYNDVTELPFDDNSVDLIYSSHLIAYFDRDEIKDVLKEWNRVLKQNGILRLATPNFRSLVKLYLKNDIKLDSLLGPLYGKWKLNGDIYHKTTYDPLSLKRLLEDNNFKNVRFYDWRETEHSQFDDHSQAYIPHMDKENGQLISLNLECKKK